MNHYILAIDQGTTSTRAMIFDTAGKVCASSQQEFKQYFPHDGWVEHDGEEIWQTTVLTCQQAITESKLDIKQIAAIGISNQRETTLLWDKTTGRLVYPAIVWQDRRTTDECKVLVERGVEPMIQQKTGLLLDPYFSASKIAWILKNVAGIQQRAERGEIAFGTIDTYLLWRLTGGKVHATDATNASRTLLFNIHRAAWDEDLLSLFAIPRAMLPVVKNSSDHFGETDPALFGKRIPITALVGDQQAATVGQACFKPGMVKTTYGTGCFMVLNTGDKPLMSTHRLLTTIAYRLNGVTTYALEGSIFVAGAAVQWLRDSLRFFQTADQTKALVEDIPDTGGVYLVPAFTGLGAPYWDPEARGGILGLTRDTGIKQIVRAALEAVCYQTRDLLEAMKQDGAANFTEIRVDGGMAVNDWLMQFLSDMLAIPVVRPTVTETSALGAAYLAGLAVGLFSSLEDIAAHWQQNHIFKPTMPHEQQAKLYEGWQEAISRITVSKKVIL